MDNVSTGISNNLNQSQTIKQCKLIEFHGTGPLPGQTVRRAYWNRPLVFMHVYVTYGNSLVIFFIFTMTRRNCVVIDKRFVAPPLVMQVWICRENRRRWATVRFADRIPSLLKLTHSHVASPHLVFDMILVSHQLWDLIWSLYFLIKYFCYCPWMDGHCVSNFMKDKDS